MSHTPRDRRDFCLGRDTKTGKKVRLRYEDRVLGATIIGKQGTGKSTILENLVLADLAHGTPGVVIDPHGQLAERVIRRATPDQAERIILLEAIRTKPFGLNLLAVRDAVDDDDDPVTWAADSVVATVKKLYKEDDEFLPRLERYLDLAARTLIPSRLTLLDAPRLFGNKTFRNQCLAHVPDPTERAELRDDWTDFDRLRPGEQITHIEAMVNRLRRLFAPALIKGIVGSKTTTVPFDQVLDGNSMMLVSLPSERLSRERCNFIGTLILCGLADRIFTRNIRSATEKKPRLHIYLDEYQRFATGTTVELISEGRKYEAGMTLAHQAIYQISDRTIREASSQSATLIALALKRRDAEDLAGEFPVKPRKERIKAIEEGTEPKLVLSATQAEDLYLAKHTDPLVDLAARSLLTGKSRYKAKSHDVPPRSGAQARPGVQIAAWDVNALLYKAANGELASPEALVDFLTEALTDDEKVNFQSRFLRPRVQFKVDPLNTCPIGPLGFMYYGFHMESPEIIPHVECVCHSISQDEISALRQGFRPLPRSECPAEHDREKLEAQWNHNKRIWEQFDRARREYRHGPLRDWLLVHVQDRRAVRDSVYTEAFRRADERLKRAAFVDSWEELFKWRRGGVPQFPASSMKALLGTPAFRSEVDARTMRLVKTLSAIELLRERLRWLLILCDGVSRKPIMVASGEQQPGTRHIVHPRQTEQDALNEFAGKLVHPKWYVAHVRTPQSYHRVKLAGPLASIAPPFQVDQVRKRSQEEYYAPGDSDEPESRSKVQQPHGRIGRRPRPQSDPAQEVLPEQPEDDEPTETHMFSGAEQGQDGESETAEPEDTEVDDWPDGFIAIIRRDAKDNGKRFIRVSDWEVIVESVPKPGDLIVTQRIWSFEPEGGGTSRLRIGNIDEDTSEITWPGE
jgi:hypothetical protein